MIKKVFLLVAIATALYAQSFSVTGDIATPLTLTADDLSKMPRATVTVKGADGIENVYDGVLLVEILKRAGAPVGENLRGKALASYVVAEASDGYQVVFSLGEIDPALTGSEILLADHANGKPLFGEMGSFRLVSPHDKRGARSVRMLTKLQVVMLRK